MTPVFQTRSGTDKAAAPSTQGNCFPAAFASLMDLTLEDAPDYDDGDDWFAPWDRWCTRQGWQWAWLTWGESLPPNAAPAGLALGSGPSPRGPWSHTIVTEDGHPVHDPAGVDVEPVPYCTSYTVFSRGGFGSELLVPIVALPESRWVPATTPHPATVDA